MMFEIRMLWNSHMPFAAMIVVLLALNIHAKDHVNR